MIFNKGFSTSDKVDNYSGRGHGMSLVKTIIEEQGGSFNINFGEGNFFAMNITLAILTGQNEPIVAS